MKHAGAMHLHTGQPGPRTHTSGTRALWSPV